MKERVLYLDLDGVFFDLDFVLRYIYKIPEEYLNETIRNEESKKVVWGALVDAVNNEWFVNMPLMEYARVIEAYAMTQQELGVRVEILTSAGSFGSPIEEVGRQKQLSLKNRFPNTLAKMKFNLVPHWTKKADFAKPGYVLYDDTGRNIDAFNAAGGIGIQYKNSNDVHEIVAQLEEITRRIWK